MKSSTKNNSPRFDCKLPPEVRAELLSPRRPRILKRSGESVPIGLILLALSVAILTAALVVLWQEGTPQQPKNTPQATPTPAPVSMLAPAPQPAPLLVSSPDDQRFFAPEVRRALPVGLEARMPYGEAVRIRILGTVPDQESLPLTGNHIGDTYHVGDAEFVWVAPDGIGKWIDP